MAFGLLQGAFELRNGVPQAGGINTASPDTIKAMPPEMTFDYFAVRLNGAKAAGKKIALAKSTLDRIQLKEITPDQAMTSGEMKIEGKREAFGEFVGLLDNFPFWFNIVTP